MAMSKTESRRRRWGMNEEEAAKHEEAKQNMSEATRVYLDRSEPIRYNNYTINPIFPAVQKTYLSEDEDVKPSDTQVGGQHYKDMEIQPTEYITKNKMGFIEGNIIKYISRWRFKNGIEDLKKIKHYVDLLIEYEGLE